MAKAVTTAPSGAVPDFIKDQAKAHVGKGSSTDQADNIIPLIYVLQGLSPQVNSRNDAYIKDAQAGDIWLRNAPKEIVKGTDGFRFQPVAFRKEWVEWVPRDDGGGRRGTFPFDALEEINEAYVLHTDGHDVPIKATYREG